MRVKPSILIAIIGLIIAVIAGQWFYFKAKFESSLPQLEDRVRAAGLELSYETRSIHGFPFRLEARYRNIAISKTAAQLSFALTSQQAVLLRQLLREDLSLLYFQEPQFAASAEAPKPGGQIGEHIMVWSAPAMQTSLRSINGQMARLSSVIERPQGETSLASIGAFAAEQLQFHMNWPIEGRRAPVTQLAPRLILNTQATGLMLEEADTRPLPQTIEKVQIGGTLHLAEYYPLEPAGLAQWQTDKGFFALSQFDLTWGDFSIGKSKGTLRLDEELLLKGPAQMTVTGLPALTYAIDKTDVLGPQEEIALLTLRLARAGATGETPITLNFDVDEGVVRLGPAPLVLLGPMARTNSNER
jgi:hypothetical protein